MYNETLRKLGDSNPRYGKPVRQFSKLVVSATHPNFQSPISLLIGALSLKRGAKVLLFFETTKFFPHFFQKSYSFGIIIGLISPISPISPIAKH